MRARWTPTTSSIAAPASVWCRPTATVWSRSLRRSSPASGGGRRGPRHAVRDQLFASVRIQPQRRPRGVMMPLYRAWEDAMSAAPTLKKALSQRQLTMIAIGGVIGAGLFVGSGVVIGDTGPGVFLTYGMAGVLIIMVMRMLAEMAVANPSTGSFADYSRDALGHWAGFSVGWLYWYFWVIVVGFEAIAGAKIVQYWLDVPLWLCALAFMVLMTATNLFSVKSYGEFEFWFAGIKVAAIVVFIAVGACFVLGLWPNKSADFSNLWSNGGFMPMGFGVITVGIVTVIFSMVGPEIATIAAAESADPETAVTKAANSVIWRILIFYVFSVVAVLLIKKWNDEGLSASTLVSAF